MSKAYVATHSKSNVCETQRRPRNMVNLGSLNLGSYILSSMCRLLPSAAASFQLDAVGYRDHKRLHLCLLRTLPVAFWNKHAAAHSLCSVTIAVSPIVQKVAGYFD